MCRRLLGLATDLRKDIALGISNLSERKLMARFVRWNQGTATSSISPIFKWRKKLFKRS
jgi:hypothetical protein